MFLECIFYLILGPLLFVAGMALKLFSSIPILFYRGILVSFLAAILQLIMLLLRFPTALLSARSRTSSWFPISLSLVSICFAFNITFLIVFPVTFDRSVTTFLLEVLDSSKQGLTQAELQQSLVDDYVNKQQAVDRRMQEQIYSKNVEHCEDRYCLTAQGQNFMRFERWIKQLFGISNRNQTDN